MKPTDKDATPPAPPVSKPSSPDDGSPSSELPSLRSLPPEVRERLVPIRVEIRGKVVWEPGVSDEERARRIQEVVAERRAREAAAKK